MAKQSQKGKHKNLAPKQPHAEQELQREQTQTALAQQVVGLIRQEYSGPLPPPNMLEEYNNAIPNGAERIMVMAEEQSAHRRSLEKQALNTDSRNSLLGILCAITLGLTTVLTGAFVVTKGHDWPGVFLGSAGLGGLVYAFIYGTRERRKEREDKAKK